MSGSKLKRQIRRLVQLLIKRYNVPSVHAEDIADCLDVPPGIWSKTNSAYCMKREF